MYQEQVRLLTKGVDSSKKYMGLTPPLEGAPSPNAEDQPPSKNTCALQEVTNFMIRRRSGLISILWMLVDYIPLKDDIFL